MRVAQEKRVIPSQVHHVMTAEEAFPFIAEGRCLAFLTQFGALRIARGAITVRPLMEEDLLLKTYIAARSDDKSKIASELVRTFVRKVSQFNVLKQLPLPMPAQLLNRRTGTICTFMGPNQSHFGQVITPVAIVI
jgi:hypothetical protein